MDTTTLIINATISLVVGVLSNRVSRAHQATQDVAVEAPAPSRDKPREQVGQDEHVAVELPAPQVEHTAASRLETRPQRDKDGNEQKSAETSDQNAHDRELEAKRKDLDNAIATQSIAAFKLRILFLQGKLRERQKDVRDAKNNLHHNAIAMGDDHDREVDHVREEVAQAYQKSMQELEEQLRQAEKGRDEARKLDDCHIQQIRELDRKLEETERHGEVQREAEELQKLLAASERKVKKLVSCLAHEKQKHESTRRMAALSDEATAKQKAEAVIKNGDVETAAKVKAKQLELEQEQNTHEKTQKRLARRHAKVAELEAENAALREQLASERQAAHSYVEEEKRLHEAFRSGLTAKGAEITELSTELATVQSQLNAEKNARHDEVAEEKRKNQLLEQQRVDLDNFLAEERKDSAPILEHAKTQANRIVELEQGVENLKQTEKAKTRELKELRAELAAAQEKLKNNAGQETLVAFGQNQRANTSRNAALPLDGALNGEAAQAELAAAQEKLKNNAGQETLVAFGQNQRANTSRNAALPLDGALNGEAAQAEQSPADPEHMEGLEQEPSALTQQTNDEAAAQEKLKNNAGQETLVAFGQNQRANTSRNAALPLDGALNGETAQAEQSPADPEHMEGLKQDPSALTQQTNDEAAAAASTHDDRQCQVCGRELIMGECSDIDCQVKNWDAHHLSADAGFLPTIGPGTSSYCYQCGAEMFTDICFKCFNDGMSFLPEDMPIDLDFSGLDLDPMS